MRFAPLLLALLVGCTPFEEPSGPPDLPASVVRTFPEDDENNVPGTTRILVEFDRVPEEVSLRLRPRTGDDIAGTTVGDPAEVVREFVPEEPLSPDVDYIVDVAWASGSYRFEFETSLLGFPLDDGDLEELPDMAWAVLIEPFGDALDNLPIVPVGQDFAVLIGVQKDSALEDGLIDLLVAPTVAGTQLQDQCQETTIITAGPDGELGTDDDAPGTWDNPRITASGERFATGDAGQVVGAVALQDWGLDASVLPSRQGLFVHSLTAHASTRGLDGLVPSDGPFGGDSFCDVLEEFGAGECVRCPSGTREERCLPIELTDYEGETRASPIRERTCVDIIDSHYIGVICDGEDARYDEDGDGFYELCPEWHEQEGR